MTIIEVLLFEKKKIVNMTSFESLKATNDISVGITHHRHKRIILENDSNMIRSGRMISFLPFEWVLFCCGNCNDAFQTYYRLLTQENLQQQSVEVTNRYVAFC